MFNKVEYFIILEMYKRSAKKHLGGLLLYL